MWVVLRLIFDKLSVIKSSSYPVEIDKCVIVYFSLIFSVFRSFVFIHPKRRHWRRTTILFCNTKNCKLLLRCWYTCIMPTGDQWSRRRGRIKNRQQRLVDLDVSEVIISVQLKQVWSLYFELHVDKIVYELIRLLDSIR